MNKSIVFLILLLICATILFGGYTFMKYKLEQAKSEYYKEQMLNFCQITEVFLNETYPNTYPCERWLINENR